MDDNQRKIAYQMHKSFFGMVDHAIKNECYLEAIVLEYAAIESRISVIMSILDMPCSACSFDVYKKITISRKVACIKQFIKNETLFGKTKITRDDLHALEKWFPLRNDLIHNLYIHPENYQDLIQHAKDVALEGQRISNLLYAEVRRIRNAYHKDPELLKNNVMTCPKAVKKEACLKAREEQIISKENESNSDLENR